ncbi:hypothetical protein [Nocardia sp. NPDC004123]
MTTATGAFFSWTARKIALPDLRAIRNNKARKQFDELARYLHLDVRIATGRRECRLLSCGEPHDEDVEYTALLIGDTYGSRDVPIRIVDSEILLLAAARSELRNEVLLSVTRFGRPHSMTNSELATQLFNGGPIANLLALADIASVVVDDCGETIRAA